MRGMLEQDISSQSFDNIVSGCVNEYLKIWELLYYYR